jgi:hypothetical protein
MFSSQSSSQSSSISSLIPSILEITLLRPPHYNFSNAYVSNSFVPLDSLLIQFFFFFLLYTFFCFSPKKGVNSEEVLFSNNNNNNHSNHPFLPIFTGNILLNEAVHLDLHNGFYLFIICFTLSR